MFVSRTRVPTKSELKRRPSEGGEKAVNYGCAMLFFGVGPMILVSWVLAKSGVTDLGVRIVCGVVIGMLCTVPAILGLRKQFQGSRRRQGALRDDAIEEWEVESRRVLELEPLGDDEPVLVFEVDDSTCILLKGQWLRETEIYGAPEHEDDPSDEYLNGLQPPKAFPTLKFTLARWPGSGRVISVTPRGDYVEPAKSDARMKKEYYFRDSELLKGDMSQLQELLDKTAEQPRRKSRK